MNSNHPALSPVLGRSNVATLASEYRRLELHENVPAAAAAYRRAGELLVTMWQAAEIATAASVEDIAAAPPVEDEATAIRRRLEQLWHDAKREADEVISRSPGTDDSRAAIVRMEVLADLIEDLESLDLVPTLAEILGDKGDAR